VNKKQEVCPFCKIYKDKKDEFLKSNSSAYDAVVDMMFFLGECEKSCKVLHSQVYTKKDEKPDCEKCDYCLSGFNCEYCGPGTGYPNYQRTEVIYKK
jgi:hypothetical protein